MLSAEMQYSAKALMVKPGGGSTSDDAECVRMLTEVTFGDSMGDSDPVVFQQTRREDPCRGGLHIGCVQAA